MLCVRRYLRYSLSYRDLEEMMAEHSGSVPSSRAPASESFLAGGQTYVRVAGNWRHLYRAVDSAGDTIDFMLSPKRDLSAAKLFLRLALSGTGGIRPRVINVDGHPAYACYRGAEAIGRSQSALSALTVLEQHH